MRRPPERDGGGWIGRIRRRPGIYRLVRSIVSPLLPGRGARRLLDRLPRGRRILNVGSGPLVHRPEVINVDAHPHPGVRVLARAGALPFRDGSIDGVISEALLEHVSDPDRAIAEFSRCLRPGGLLYLSVPFLQPHHSAPRDFVRWTLPGLRRLIRDLEPLESGIAGGPTAALTWIVAEYLGIGLSFGSAAIQEVIALLFRCLLAPLKAVDILLVHLPASEILASLLYILARKGGDPAGE